jgi:chromosome segregation ATPase
MVEGRRAESDRRRQRVLTALEQATAGDDDITVSSIARRAGVDRTFLYRHRDLLQRLHALEAQPAPSTASAIVSRASLQSDLAAAQQRAGRLAAQVQLLERRLSDLLGEETWRESGLGAPHDIDQLNQRIASLEAQVADLRIELDERTDELAAARLANRELMTRVNVAKTAR